MAHKETIQNSELAGCIPGANAVYTVSTNVGYGYKNKVEDVRLVQFFLNACAKDLSDGWHNRPAPLVTDGIFGGKTWAAIKSFQKVTMGAVTDGMITPVDGKRMYSHKQHRVYTMYYLNWYYWLGRSEHFNDIRTDPELPSELRTYLSGPLPNLD